MQVSKANQHEHGTGFRQNCLSGCRTWRHPVTDFGLTVVNLGARLCAQAANGQILVDGRVQLAAESIASMEPLGELDLKGLHRPVRAFNVRELTA